jgi:hypothetical protein
MATAANMMGAPDSEAALTVQRFLKTYSHGPRWPPGATHAT